MGFIFLFGVGSGLHMENVFCFVINENQTLGSWPSRSLFIRQHMSVFCLWLTPTSCIVTWICLCKLFAESKQHGGIRANNLCCPRGEDSKWCVYAESVIMSKGILCHLMAPGYLQKMLQQQLYFKLLLEDCPVSHEGSDNPQMNLSQNLGHSGNFKDFKPK